MAKELDKAGNWAAQMAERKPPRAALGLTDMGALEVRITGEWDRILKASGNVAVSEGLISQAAALGSHGRRTDAAATDFVLGFVDSMRPEDAAEALLLAQMAATHQATMTLAGRLNKAENITQQDAAERALNKLARTFSAQMDTLKRYRSKGQQVVRVERVTVEEGGQAIVGNVEHRGRAGNES